MSADLLPPMKWNAWGDPDQAKPLSEGIRALLTQALGVTDSPEPELDADQVRLRPSQLATDHREALAAIVGPDHFRVDDRDRLLRAGGKSTLDLLRRKDSGLQDAPDAVLLPGSDDEVAAILRYCSQHGIAVVPFGGGTSVVGGLDPIRGDFAAAVSLDLRRFDQLLDFDEVSGEAEFGAGVTGPRAEELLGAQGFSLGHFPQSFEFASIGGFAATRSSGQDSAGYGRFDDMIRGLRVITPAGVLDLGRAPQSAAGPDLRQLVIGSEGVFGVITRVRVRGPPGAAGHPLRSVVVPRLRHRRRGIARCHPDRHRADRDPAFRRGRDRGQPGHHRIHRRWPDHRGLPGDHGVRRHAGTRGEQARRNPGADDRARAARHWAKTPPEPGSVDDSARRTCATRCWPTARCARRSRRLPTGRMSPR